MGLVNNCFRIYWDGALEGSAHALLPAHWDSYRQWEKFIMPDMASAVLQTAADPPGFYLSRVFQPPIKVGEMSWRPEGTGTLTANLYPSRSMAVAFTGTGDLTAIGALVISMAAAFTGTGSLTAGITGNLNMSADLTGTGTLAADLSALGNMLAGLTGTGGLAATIAAYGDMTIDFTVTGTGLSTSNVGPAVLDAVLEDGITLGEALRVIAAALAGKTTGAGTSTMEFTGLDGATIRITGTLDGSGNRTAVTLDGA